MYTDTYMLDLSLVGLHAQDYLKMGGGDVNDIDMFM